jgi:hypothetical protein
MILGLVLVVVGLLGVVFTTFLISRELTATYGTAGTAMVQRALKDKTVPTRLRVALRVCSVLTAIGAFLIISAALT